jgi:hypothetical protein
MRTDNGLPNARHAFAYAFSLSAATIRRAIGQTRGRASNGFLAHEAFGQRAPCRILYRMALLRRMMLQKHRCHSVTSGRSGRPRRRENRSNQKVVLQKNFNARARARACVRAGAWRARDGRGPRRDIHTSLPPAPRYSSSWAAQSRHVLSERQRVLVDRFARQLVELRDVQRASGRGELGVVDMVGDRDVARAVQRRDHRRDLVKRLRCRAQHMQHNDRAACSPWRPRGSRSRTASSSVGDNSPARMSITVTAWVDIVEHLHLVERLGEVDDLGLLGEETLQRAARVFGVVRFEVDAVGAEVVEQRASRWSCRRRPCQRRR